MSGETVRRRGDLEDNKMNRRGLLVGSLVLGVAGCSHPTESKPAGVKESADNPAKSSPESNESSEFEQQKQEFLNVGASFGDKLIDDINEQLKYDKNYYKNAPEGAVPEFGYRYYPGNPEDGIDPWGQMTVVSPILHTEAGDAYRVEVVYGKLDPSIYGESDDNLLTNDLSGLKGMDVKEIDIVKYPDVTGGEEGVDYGDESNYEITTEIDVVEEKSGKKVRIIDDAPYIQGSVSEAMSFKEAMSLLKELETGLEHAEN